MANLTDSTRIILTPSLREEKAKDKEKTDTIPDDSYSLSDSEVLKDTPEAAEGEPSDWRFEYRRIGRRPVRGWWCPLIYLPFLYAYAFFGAFIFMVLFARLLERDPNAKLTDPFDCDDHKPFSDLILDGLPYAISVFTTVGYGTQTPKSDWGRVLTICYALAGIPLYFAFSADLQDIMDRVIFVWLSKLFFRQRFQHHISRWKKFLVMFAVYMVYMFLQGLITMLIENSFERRCNSKSWNYLDSIYFIFQSAALIGFGDMMTARNLYLLVHLPMITIGQVLLTGLFTAMIKYIRYKFPKWTLKAWRWLRTKLFGKERHNKAEKGKGQLQRGRGDQKSNPNDDSRETRTALQGLRL